MHALGPFVLMTSLPADRLARSRAYFNARYLLEAAARTPLPATRTLGDLAPPFVQLAVSQMRWPDTSDELVHFVTMMPEERDVPPLRRLRLALEHGGLLRKYRGAFHATAGAHLLLEAGHEGDLYLALFDAYFRLPAPGLAREPADPRLLQGLVQLLWQLHEAHGAAVCGSALLATLQKTAGHDADGRPAAPLSDAALQRELLEPLEELGLIALAWTSPPEDEDHPPRDDQPVVQATPLFDQFLVAASRLN